MSCTEKYNPKAFKRVYKIDFSAATDVEQIQNTEKFQQDEHLGLLIDGQTIEQSVLSVGWQGLSELDIFPVSKTLVVDLVERLHYPHDKVEGLWVIDEQYLAVLNDDDYGFSETNGVMEQKYINADKTKIDSNTLYIIDGLNF